MKKIFCLTFLLSLIHLSYSQSYEYASGKYQAFKITSKIDTIKIVLKLPEGTNTITKTSSGDILNAIVKNGAILKFTMTNSSGENIQINPPPLNPSGDNAKITLVCMKCFVTHREGKDYYVCQDVPCGSRGANAVRQISGR